MGWAGLGEGDENGSGAGITRCPWTPCMNNGNSCIIYIVIYQPPPPPLSRRLSFLSLTQMARRQEAKERYMKRRRAGARGGEDGMTNETTSLPPLPSLTAADGIDASAEYYEIVHDPRPNHPPPSSSAIDVPAIDAAIGPPTSPITSISVRPYAIKIDSATIATSSDATDECAFVNDGADGTTGTTTLDSSVVVDDIVLDTRGYHRGRAGYEPRCASTGELLSDIDNPVDTNHYWRPPHSLCCNVTVSFPLVDDDDDDDDDYDDDNFNVIRDEGDGDYPTEENEDGEGGKGFGRVRPRRARVDDAVTTLTTSSTKTTGKITTASTITEARTIVPRFVQVVEWDLTNPCTPSPEEYAARVSSEFGLSFPQAMDLETLIRRQLDVFCRGCAVSSSHLPPPPGGGSSSRSFYAPLAILDPYGSERPDSHYGPPESRWGPMWRDDARWGGRGGDGPNNGESRVRFRGSGLGGGTNRGSGGGGRSARPMGAIKPDRGVVRVVPKDLIPEPNASGDVHAGEVLRRARAFSERIVAERIARGEGTMSHAVNELCHICHYRKASGLTFHCGAHTYCDFHCAVSWDDT